MPEPPSYYLRLFDRSNLEEFEQRRLAAYALVEYYGQSLSEIGNSYLQFDHQDREQSIRAQWNKAMRRLEAADVSSIPDEYNDPIQRLWDTRNSIAHNYEFSPKVNRLTDARDIAEEWKEWLTERAKKYAEIEVDSSLQETISVLTEDALEEALSPPESYDYTELQQRQTDINQKIWDILKYTPNRHIDEDKPYEIQTGSPSTAGSFNASPSEEPDMEVAKHPFDFYDYREAKKLRSRTEKLRKKNASWKEEEFSEKISSSEIRCVVIEPYEEDSDYVQLMAPGYFGESKHILQNIQELSQKGREILKQKGEFDTVDVYLFTRSDGKVQINQILE